MIVSKAGLIQHYSTLFKSLLPFSFFFFLFKMQEQSVELNQIKTKQKHFIH